MIKFAIMIQLTELRLGNKLLHGDKVVSVSAIFKSHFNAEDENGITRNCVQENLQPIPLTIEWLEKLGFNGKYKSCGYVYQCNGFEITSQDEDDYGNSIPDYVLHFYYHSWGQPLYFVHQLQNLYFAHTGKELEMFCNCTSKLCTKRHLAKI